MDALIFDETLKYVTDYNTPKMDSNEALIKISMVGICNTDLEITKGYMGYKGILGHEFVGIVEEVENPKDKNLIGKRVVGEINLGCGNCNWCNQGLSRHCPNRSTLGILNKEGCFAQYLTLPVSNLLVVPDSIPDEVAVFTEPLAAALEILEQLHIKPYEKVAVLGDGKLGLLIALALNASNIDINLIGKHQNKLDIAKNQGINTELLSDIKIEKKYDVVIEATGSVSGFQTSIALVKPRGVLVLKSTIASEKDLNLAPVVIDEITILGSRCGQFAPALRLMEKNIINFSPLISKILPFKQAIEGFELNRKKDTIKILLKL